MNAGGARLFLGSVTVVLVLTACGVAPGTAVPGATPSSPTSTSTSTPASTTSSAPATTSTSDIGSAPETTTGESETIDGRDGVATTGTAAEALAPFFTAVDEIDGRLQTAAAAVNAALGQDTATFDQSTVDAVDAAAPWAAAAAIPSGLDPAAEQAVLLVYSDLVSRFGALRGGDCLQVGTVPRASLNADCFVRGHEAKVRMSEDIRAAQAAAAVSAIDPPDPGAHEAAEVPLRIQYINKANLGCGTMGGFIATEPITVEWATEPSDDPAVPPTDGTVNGIRFRASYSQSDGWTVDLLAC